jgi:lipopolysaccharide export LptBFGC system permease protein LptF
MGKKTGSWSVKDVLAHLAVENDWLALQLERRARGEVKSPEELQRVEELGLADNQTRNTYYAQLHKDLTWPLCVTGIGGPTSACSPP